jgi:hypothetical protein
MVLLLFTAMQPSCNQPFDPTGPSDQQLVVFTILSTDRSVQFVRVTEPFLSAGFDPASTANIDNFVTDANVNIETLGHYERDRYGYATFVEGDHWHLRDSALVRPGSTTSAYPLHVYAANPFLPKNGVKYYVYVASPSHGQANGSVRIPQKPTLTLPYATILLLNDPQQHEPDAPIKFQMTLGDSVKGYVSRLHLDYSVLRDGEWISERVEVPVSSLDPANFSLTLPTYPTMTECTGTNLLSVSFQNGYLRSVIRKLTDVTYAGEKIIFERVTFMVLQAEPNLYNYYATSQLERDPRSIRLDQPPITKLNGRGYGLIGGYTLDSIVYSLPERFYANNR